MKIFGSCANRFGAPGRQCPAGHASPRELEGLLACIPHLSVSDIFSAGLNVTSAADLIRKAQQAGFSVRKVTSFVPLLLPLMMLSRLRIRYFGEVYGPRREFRIGGTAN